VTSGPAAPRAHRYDVAVRWTGNRGGGTSGYRDYDRSHLVGAPGRPDIAGSSDPAFRGETDRWNPEQLLVAALAQCHLLWYLSLAATSGVIVVGYTDDAVGTMVEDPDGGGHFTEVLLRPAVTVARPDMAGPAAALHGEAHRKCFIARSVNFPVRHEPVVLVAEPGTPAGR
jgi:organic hydroperoxide reductase OsmC/OhrA